MSADAVSVEELPPKVFVVPSNTDSDENISGPRLELDFFGRVVQLPVVDQTLTIVSNLYGKVKDSNSAVTWTLETATSTMGHAADSLSTSPCFVASLGKVDNFLCSSLDYFEDKVPTIKLPPQEILNKGKQYLHDTCSWMFGSGVAKTSDVGNLAPSASTLALPSRAEKASGSDASITNLGASALTKVYTTLADVTKAIDTLELVKKTMEPEVKPEETIEILQDAEQKPEDKLVEADKSELNLKTA